jgi:hypothetical protein
MAQQDDRELEARAKRRVGPTSIEGVEASDLPDKGKGPVETNFGKELRRDLPEHTGEVIGEDDSGLRGQPDLRDTDARGNRGKN